MSCHVDSIYRTIEWLRANGTSFRAAFAGAWGRWARVRPRDVQIRVGLVNYKPFERGRVMADATFVPGRAGSMPVTLNLFIHIFAENESATRELEECAGNILCCCYGPPVFRLDDQRAVVWVLPNAPKRALLTWENPTDGARYYLKLIEGREAAAAALNLMEMSARAEHGELSFNVPACVHYSPSWHTLMMTEVPGRPFTEVMREARREMFAEVGRDLACLHDSGATPAAIWSPQKELDDLRRHMNGVQSALPEIASRLGRLVDRLERSLPGEIAHYRPIHGNLFGDQILYDEGAAERRVGMVDWDALALGDPHYDLGRLIAHWVYVARLEGLPRSAVNGCTAAFLQAYEDDAQCAVERATLRWHVAAALLQRAKISSLRKLCPGWQQHFGIVVREAEAMLGTSRLASRRHTSSGISTASAQREAAPV